ncbi:MAG: DUF86 domain-containing protein [bacterium]|nr:DUF86 domain-containing protein [bacterium]
MSEKNWIVRIEDILERIQRINRYVEKMSFSEFTNDLGTQDKIGFNFVVIGEAARYIPKEIEEEFPQVNWVRMRGMRNRIAHNYNQIDLPIVWATIQEDLPPITPVLQKILVKYSK